MAVGSLVVKKKGRVGVRRQLATSPGTGLATSILPTYVKAFLFFSILDDLISSLNGSSLALHTAMSRVCGLTIWSPLTCLAFPSSPLICTPHFQAGPTSLSSVSCPCVPHVGSFCSLYLQPLPFDHIACQEYVRLSRANPGDLSCPPYVIWLLYTYCVPLDD